MPSDLDPPVTIPDAPASPAAPAVGSRSIPSWLTGRALSSSLIVAGVTLVATLVLATIATLLLPLALLGHDLSLGGTTISPSQFTSSGSAPSPAGFVLLIAALALLGQVDLHASGGGTLIDATLAFAPLLLTVVIGFAAAWAASSVQRLYRATSRSAMVMTATMSAVAFGVVMLILLLVLPLAASEQGFEVSLSGANPHTFLGAAVLTFLASLLGRWTSRFNDGVGAFPRRLVARMSSAPVLVRDLVESFAIGAVAFGVVAIIGGFIAVGSQLGWGTAGAGLLLYAGPVAVYSAAIGQFGALWSSSTGLSGSGSDLISVLNGPPVLWTLVLVAIVVVCLSALRLSRRREWSARRQLATAWRFPTSVAALWLVLPWLAITLVSGSGAIPIFGGGSLSSFVTVAPWFFLIAGLWAAGVEALGRFVAPRLVSSYPLAARVSGSKAGTVFAEIPEPLDARGRRAWAVGGITAAVVVAVLVLGGVTIATLGSTIFGPEAALSGYVSAIQRGDLAAATKLVPVSEASDRLLTGKALPNARDRITKVSTKVNSTSGGSAVGTVIFSIAGHKQTIQLQLKSSGTQFGVFPQWHVTTPMTEQVSIGASSGKTALLNGIAVPLQDGFATATVYPGRYTASLPSTNKWFTAKPVTIIPGASGGSATLLVKPTPALVTEVTSQITSLIDKCVATAQPQSAGCPFQEYTFGTVSGFSWHVDAYPTVSIEGDGSSFELNGGQVTADFVESDFGFSDHQNDPQGIYGYGSLTFTGDKVTAALQ